MLSVRPHPGGSFRSLGGGESGGAREATRATYTTEVYKHLFFGSSWLEKLYASANND